MARLKICMKKWLLKLLLRLSKNLNEMGNGPYEDQVLGLQICLSKAEVEKQKLEQELINVKKEHTNMITAAVQREQELGDRINRLLTELNVLRSKTKNSSRCSISDSNIKVCCLTNEVDSLRAVLEVKHTEISALSKMNAKLKRENDERFSFANRLSLFEAQTEMLRFALEEKVEKEKDYKRQINDLQMAYKNESLKRQRLSFDKEELQWNLQQRSKQLPLGKTKAKTKLQQMSHGLDMHSSGCRGNEANGSLSSAPIIKKAKSVAWVIRDDC